VGAAGRLQDLVEPGRAVYIAVMSDKQPQFREVQVPQSRDVSGDASKDPAKTAKATRRIPAPGAEVTVPPRLDPRAAAKDLPPERGGYDGPEPTRFGDWEHKGRTTDF
jgi:hypothetical protein